MSTVQSESFIDEVKTRERRLSLHGFHKIAEALDPSNHKVYTFTTNHGVEVSPLEARCRVPFGSGKGRIVLSEGQMKEIAKYYIIMFDKGSNIKLKEETKC